LRRIAERRERFALSYDLVLLSNDGKVSRQDLWDHLAMRPHVEVNEHDIMYESGETDVHFQWVFAPYHLDEMNDVSSPVHPDELGHLRLNYYRPTVFAEEAALELIAASDALPLAFLDLQESAVYTSFTDPAQLSAPYKRHAQDAISALEQSEHRFERPFWLDTKALQVVWKWNFQRDQLYESLGVDLFVPKVDFYQIDCDLKTGVAWGGGVRMLCPNVDVVLAIREQAPPRWGWFAKKEMRVDILLFEEFKRDYANWFSPDARVPRSVSCAPDVAEELRAALNAAPVRRPVALQGQRDGHDLQQVALSSILDTDLWASVGDSTARLLTIPAD